MIDVTRDDLVTFQMTPDEAAQLHAALQSNVSRAWVEFEKRGVMQCWTCISIQGSLADGLTQAGVPARCQSEQEVR